MKAILLSVCFCVMLASGCASRGPLGSFAGPLPEKGAVTAIADDAASILAELYPPGHTTIRLLPATTENGFALVLENGLRAKGFTLVSADSSNTLTLAYTLDMLEEKTAWYLQLRFSDGKTIARSYNAHGQPEAGQSRTVLEDSNSGKAVDAVKAKAGHAFDAIRDFPQQ